MALIDDIQERYPNPTVFRLALSEEEYCVGGAVVLYSGFEPDATWPGFPLPTKLARALVALNPCLSWGDAYALVPHIVISNDEGMFSKAWGYVRQGLEYDRGVE